MQKPFILPSTETKPIQSYQGMPPQKRRDAEIMSDDNKRDFSANLIDTLVDALKMPRVESNAELADRIVAYLNLCTEKRIPPTWEGLGLYVGYSRSTLWDWASGRNKGFSDVESGLTTSALVKKARELFAAFDATMAITGNINPIPYIFRSTNYYGLINKSTVAIEPQADLMRPPATPEEIAKNLPELDSGLIDLFDTANE